MSKTSLKHQVYADDTTMYVPVNEDTIHGDSIKTDIHLIIEWFKRFGLSLNASKTEICLFKSFKNKFDIKTFDICQETINLKDSIETLGTTIDRYVRLENQVK